DHIRAAHAALGAGEVPPMPPDPPANAGPAERAARDALGVLAGAPEPEIVPAPKTPFVAPDALTNPAYSRFALKTTAAAVICFLIYTAIDWQGIHTAMITCYVAALATTGETVHKLALRITGCLIGAAIGVAAIFWVIPLIDGIGALMVLVFFGCLVGAWVSTGPERIAYAGVQVALAFLLTVLQGFGPSVSLDTAQGRIFGILLGNLVVYLIFTRIWPAPVEGEVRAWFAHALSELARMARLAPERRANAVGSAAAVEALAGKAEEALRVLPFEPRGLRPTPARETALHGAVTQIEALNRTIWLSRDADLEHTAKQLERLAERFRGPAGEPEPHPGSGPSASPARPDGPAPSAGPFARPLDRLQGAAG
ncbi:FUSC family protein, partial [Thiocapsa sp.]|uniref:FUSC family protein n=1 Tax=Thiocapsa sp. TaxID=2024551 RepID=UPI0025D3EC1C